MHPEPIEVTDPAEIAAILKANDLTVPYMFARDGKYFAKAAEMELWRNRPMPMVARTTWWRRAWSWLTQSQSEVKP